MNLEEKLWKIRGKWSGKLKVIEYAQSLSIRLETGVMIKLRQDKLSAAEMIHTRELKRFSSILSKNISSCSEKYWTCSVLSAKVGCQDFTSHQ